MFQINSNQTTMVGSMPQKNVDQAFELLKRFPLTIPAWPQLPKRSFRESMIAQYSEDLPGIKIDNENRRIWVEKDGELPGSTAVFYEDFLSNKSDSFSLSEEYAEGFRKFLDYLKTLDRKLPVVKGQVTGPFTYGLSLCFNDGKAVWFDDQYRDVVVKGLAKKALWQVEQLKKYTEKVIVFFDEPIFSALGTPAYIGIQDEEIIRVLNEFSEIIHAEDNVGLGVHCCGNMDWRLLAQSSIDIINFDAYLFGEKLGLYPEAIDKFLERGGIMAWGIVPTGNSEDIKRETYKSLLKKLDELIGLFVRKGVSEERIYNQMLFTPSCGMGTLTPEDSERIMNLLSQFVSFPEK